jgi:hypothetical protein
MTPKEQRIAIAEACGWTFLSIQDNLTKGNSDPYSAPVGFRPDPAKWYPGEGAYAGHGSDGPVIELPNYPNDLNAMHEAFRSIPDEMRQVFWWRLSEIVGHDVYDCANKPWKVFDATAAQRAEAFLRTLNLWTS